MPKIEQLRKWQAKLQEQILQEEVNELIGSKRRIVMTGGPTTDDYPLILCPACGEQVWSSEGELHAVGKRWAYFDGRCGACNTDFRIGQVSHRCALCQEPFPSDPCCDINEFHHHWYEKDGQSYCTPCFMQLFFDGYIDLSSDNPQLTDETHCTDTEALHSLWPTHVGNTVAPYCSRLAANGYEEVVVVKEWEEIGEICRRVVEEGRRYLVLGSGSRKAEDEYHYIVYRTGGRAHGVV